MSNFSLSEMLSGGRRLQLPRFETISVLDLASLIANHVHPPRSTLKGLDCLVGWQKSASIKTDNEHDFTFKLIRRITNEEYVTLASQLGKLPRLHGNMTEQERDDFLAQYSTLNPGQEWLPDLLIGPETEIERRHRSDILHIQTRELRRAIDAGELLSVTQDRTPAKKAGSILPITQAKIYLTRIGVPYADALSLEASELSGSHGKSAYRNTLDEAIEAGITRARGSLDYKTVWPELVELALVEEYGLYLDEDDQRSSKLPKGKRTISYTSDGGQQEKINRDGLRGRLRTRLKNLARSIPQSD